MKHRTCYVCRRTARHRRRWGHGRLGYALTPRRVRLCGRCTALVDHERRMDDAALRRGFMIVLAWTGKVNT